MGVRLRDRFNVEFEFYSIIEFEGTLVVIGPFKGNHAIGVKLGIERGLKMLPKTQTVVATALILLCTSCDNSAARDASYQHLKDSVVEAMCQPWGEDRAIALEKLIDASERLHPEDGDMSNSEYVGQYAWEMKSKNCTQSGYPSPGPDWYRKPPRKFGPIPSAPVDNSTNK